MKSTIYLKRGCILLSILFVVYFLFIHGLTLHKANNRQYATYSLTEEERELYAHIANISDETEIIRLCNELACKKLSFRRKNNLNIGEANCIGYAQYTTTLLNSAFKYKRLTSTARAVVGQVHLYDINIHPLVVGIMPDNLKYFFKDHDFVEIRKENGDTIFIDTSLQDLLGKSFY